MSRCVCVTEFFTIGPSRHRCVNIHVQTTVQDRGVVFITTRSSKMILSRQGVVTKLFTILLSLTFRRCSMSELVFAPPYSKVSLSGSAAQSRSSSGAWTSLSGKGAPEPVVETKATGYQIKPIPLTSTANSHLDIAGDNRPISNVRIDPSTLIKKSDYGSYQPYKHVAQERYQHSQVGKIEGSKDSNPLSKPGPFVPSQPIASFGSAYLPTPAPPQQYASSYESDTPPPDYYDDSPKDDDKGNGGKMKGMKTPITDSYGRPLPDDVYSVPQDSYMPTKGNSHKGSYHPMKDEALPPPSAASPPKDYPYPPKHIHHYDGPSKPSSNNHHQEYFIYDDDEDAAAILGPMYKPGSHSQKPSSNGMKDKPSDSYGKPGPEDTKPDMPNGQDLPSASGYSYDPPKKPYGHHDVYKPLHDYDSYLEDDEHHHHEEAHVDDERDSKRPYSYYYLGRKLWYIPLYFSVYFIIYVAALLLKSIARHKINYPYVHGWGGHQRSLNDAAGQVGRAIDSARSKYHR